MMKQHNKNIISYNLYCKYLDKPSSSDYLQLFLLAGWLQSIANAGPELSEW